MTISRKLPTRHKSLIYINEEKLNDTKLGIRILKSKKDRQLKNKRANTDLQNTTQKTKDRAT
jgi:hypothetical protein